MNRIAYTGVVVFVTALLTLGVVHFLSKDSRGPTPPHSSANADHSRAVTLDEVARHNQPDDCWMAIHGRVYDFTAYIPKHPTAPEVMHEWCGKDATQGWTTKGHGRPHSKAAEAMLDEYAVGILADK